MAHPQPQLPPGSLGPPILGETLAFVKDPFSFFSSRFERYGSVFRTRILGDPVICFVGGEGLRFLNDATYFTRQGSSPPGIQALLHPDAVPFLGGERHQARKRLLLRPFEADALASYLPLVQQLIERAISDWATRERFQWLPELDALCFRLANALFAGADPNADVADVHRACKALADGMLALPIALPFTTYGKAIRARDRLRDYVAAMVEAHKSDGPVHVLGWLASATDQAGNGLSDAELAIETLHFFLAGHGALTGVFAALVTAIAQQTAAADAVRDEVRRLSPSGALTFESLARLAAVDRFGREVRRWAKLVPMTFFATVIADCEFQGYRIPAGWKALGCLNTTHYDPASWPTPARFDPARFDGEARPPAFCPQGAGAADGHRCAGEALTDLVLNSFTSLLLRNARWELPEQDLRPLPGPALLPLPRSGLLVDFRHDGNGGAAC